MTEVDVKGIAEKVSQVDEGVLKEMPFISGLVGFIPGGAVAVPFMPLVSELLTTIDNAALAVAGGNPSAAATSVLQEIMNHLTPGKPNSPILSSTGPISN